MFLLTRLGHLWRNLVHRRRRDRDLDEELDAYVELLVAERMKDGLDPGEARRAAMIEVGGVTQVKESVRRVRAGALLDTVRTDLRQSVRSLARSPGFTLTAIACLALGIGTNTAIFSVVDTILHPRFGFPISDEMLVLQSSRPAHGIPRADVSHPDFLDWRDQSSSFAAMAGMVRRSVTLTGHDDAIQARAGAVSWNLFSLLGARPAFGRTFRQDEDRRGAPGTVMLGHELWTRHFAADSAVLGRAIEISGRQHTVIGVMPPRFRFPQTIELWIPLEPTVTDRPRGYRDLIVYARLDSAVSRERAVSELRGIAARLAEAHPGTNSAWTASAVSLADYLGSEDGLLRALAMMGAVTFVLLIACANVANLMLARGTARQREIAIRSALGAGRGRLIRMLLTESVVLAVFGGVLGLGVAALSLHMLDATLPFASVPYYIDWQIDGRALVYMASVALGTALAFGLAPALLVSGGNLQQPLKEGHRETGVGRRPLRLRGSLVVVEVALSVILVVGATLFARTLANLAAADPGFATDPIVNLRINLPGTRYADIPARARAVDDLIARIEAVPGVVAATASSTVTIDGGFFGGGVVETDPRRPSGPAIDIRWNAVTPHWFRTLDIPILRGRDFTLAEGRDRSDVAIINQSMADRVWPDEDPVGRRFRFAGDTSLPWFTVIGVTPDVRGMRPQARQEALVFLAYPYGTSGTVSVTLRSGMADPLRVVPGVRRAIREFDPNLPVFDVRSMTELRRLAYAETAVLGAAFSVFGLIALSLAAIGVYGIISYGVAQRTHEIGVRMALGARGADVVGLFIGQGIGLTLIGVLLGLAGAFALTRVLQNMLFGVTATDPLSFIGGSVLLIIVAALASSVPARRAIRVDPMHALRAE